MEKNCTVLIHYNAAVVSQPSELRKDMESNDIKKKTDALKKAIKLALNGESMQTLLMTVIRFCMPSDDHKLKMLCLIYFEIVEKTSADGKLLPEVMLMTNLVGLNLEHPNEYIRGCTLRFLCKANHPELVEPLIPQILRNMEHRHSFVRRNAVLCLFSIFKRTPELAVDCASAVEKFLAAESDVGARRTGFLMLYESDEQAAIKYLLSILDRVSSFGDILQIAILEVIRKICRRNPAMKANFVTVLTDFLSSGSAAVVFEAAGTLLSLSSAASAVKAAAGCYCKLLTTLPDNNVKMIILDRLGEIKVRFPGVLEEMALDIMRALSTPSMDIRRKVLDIASDLASPKNIDEVVAVLKKEVQKTQTKDFQDADGEYRHLLINTIHQFAVKFPDVATAVVHLLMEFLGDSHATAAVDVIYFVREIVQTYPILCESVLSKLFEGFSSIKSSRVLRCALWIFGEYCQTVPEIAKSLHSIKSSLGELPLFEAPVAPKEGDVFVSSEPAIKKSSRPIVLADGTYATQTAADTVVSSSLSTASVHSLRSLLLSGDFFLGCVVATTLTKLSLRLCELSVPTEKLNSTIAQSLLICCGIIRLGQSGVTPHPIDRDSYNRMCICMRVLSDPSPIQRQVFLKSPRESFAAMLSEKLETAEKNATSSSDDDNKVLPSDPLQVRLLKPKGGDDSIFDGSKFDVETAAVGEDTRSDDTTSRLNRIVQLTGLSDPVYAEAVVTVHKFDIVMDILLLNQTETTLKNLNLELSTVGDLKLCERLQTYNLGPRQSVAIKASVKVSSTETGIIFGTVTFDGKGDTISVILNDIHIDIMDYIFPSTCTELAFRTMWVEFEWENKVAILTNITSEHEYLSHVAATTNMNILTPKSQLEGDCGFLAANLYAKSIFGEDALANVSIEKQADGKIGGYVRIRSKTQGIALSLGEKITSKQKSV